MTEIVQEITSQGLRLPKQLLEDCGLAEGRRVLITRTAGGLLIRPEEAAQKEVTSLAVRYLLRSVGDNTSVRTPEQEGGRWRAQVVLRTNGQPIGDLYFDLHGVLLAEESTSPEALLAAADAA